MKIKLTIDLDLPEKYQECTDPELRMLLHEEFMRAVHQYHMEAVLDLSVVDQGGEHVSAMLKEARNHHLEWAKISDVPDWWVERM